MGNVRLQRVGKTQQKEVIEKPVVQASPVEAAVRRYEAIREQMLSFMQGHAAVFEQLDQLAVEYNAAIDQAKAELQVAGILDGVYTGSFKRSNPPRSITYDKTKLPADVLAMPNVLTVDEKVVDALAKAGIIDRNVLDAAQVVSYGTPRVNTPKQITLRVGD